MLPGYNILRKLGSGGFGDVLLAEEQLSGRKVAIKSLKTSASKQDALLNEIRIISQFYHKNIVIYHNAFTVDDTIYFVMEYCNGGSLANVIENQNLPEKSVTKIILDIAKAIKVVHDHNIVHNDIKPANLLLSEDDIVKLADFGVSNGRGGTKLYQPPNIDEIGYSLNDFRLDIFALGITYAELLTSKNPLKNLTKSEALSKLKIGKLGIENFPDWIQQIIHNATHPNVNNRYQNIQELIEAIEANRSDITIDKTHITASRLGKRFKWMLDQKRYYSLSKEFNQIDKKLGEFPAILQQTGCYHLAMNNIEKAKQIFERLKEKMPSIPIYKELGNIYLELGQYPSAIGFLTEHLTISPDDCEAYNLLLECYFRSKRFKKGLLLCKDLQKTFPKEICFMANEYLFRQLSQEYESKTKKSRSLFELYNDDIFSLGNTILNINKKDQLIDKLLFCHYSLTKVKGLNTKLVITQNGVSVDIDNKYLITIGRKEYFNDIEFHGTSVSRKHCLIVTLTNENWIYDLGSTGTYVDGIKIKRRMRLTHKHTIKIGDYELIVNVDKTKLF